MRKFTSSIGGIFFLMAFLALSGLRCLPAGGGAPETEGQPEEGEQGVSIEGDTTQEGEGEPLSSAAFCAGDCGYVIVKVHPHDPGAFTQGLVYLDGSLYEGTGLVGQSTLRRVELETGRVLQQVSVPRPHFGEGITLFENRIYQLTWKTKTGFIYDKDTFEVLQEFSYNTEGWGLTHDDSRLIMSDGTDHLYFMDPYSLTVQSEILVHDASGPVSRLNELEWISGVIFANVWQTDIVVRIDPQSGQVLGRVNLSGLLSQADLRTNPDVLNGFAYDAEGDRLFVTGKYWPKLFEIRLTPAR